MLVVALVPVDATVLEAAVLAVPLAAVLVVVKVKSAKKKESLKHCKSSHTSFWMVLPGMKVHIPEDRVTGNV